MQAVYTDIKIEAIADLMAQCYNARNPPRPVNFVPCFIYILSQRPKQPAVRVEPLIFSHEKVLVRKSVDASQEELDTLEAFELFCYLGSEKQFVVCNPHRVGEFWSEPEFHSADGGLGGLKNRGIKGINVFLLRHQFNDTCQKVGLQNPSSVYVEKMARLMTSEKDEDDARQVSVFVLNLLALLVQKYKY